MLGSGYHSAGRRVRPRARRLAALVALSALAPRPASTQDQPLAPASSAQFKVEVGLVLLAASVRDAAGNPVPALQRADFAVYEDGVEQEIVHFEEEDSPAAIVLLLDASSSMQGGPLQAAQRDALAFIEQVDPESELALLAFDRRPRLVQDLARDRAGLRAAIEQLEARGGTALYDALAQAIELAQTAAANRKIIVVLSDGQDLDSATRFGALVDRVKASAVVIFTLGEYSAAEHKLFMTGAQYTKEPALEVNLNPVWVLQSLAELTGGAAFFPAPGRPLGPLWARIAREIHHQYVLGYHPPPRIGPTRFHQVEVRAISAAHPEPLRVRTRRGYADHGSSS